MLPPDNAGQWHDAVALEAARYRETEFILNLTGGTRSMMFGALAGLQTAVRESGATVRGIVYHSGPSRIEDIYPEVSPPRELPPELLLASPDMLRYALRLRGVYEREPTQSRKAYQAALERAELTHRLADAIFGDGLTDAQIRQRAGWLHGPVAGTPEIPEGAPEAQDWIPLQVWGHEAIAFWRALCAMPGADRLVVRGAGNGAFSIAGRDGRKYLSGGWFEEWALLHSIEALQGNPRCAASINVELSYSLARTDGEFDVVLLVEGFLHIVECKAGELRGADGEPKVWRQDIQRLDSWKNLIVGQGTAALLCLQPPASDRDRDIMTEEAQQKRVQFWYGRPGLQHFKNWLRDLAAQARGRAAGAP